MEEKTETQCFQIQRWKFREDTSCSTIQGRGVGVGVSEGILLVAIGCGRLPGILDIAARHPFVAFGTMEGEVFSGLIDRIAVSSVSALKVYFYETG
ncbi:MAG: hypothetical protein ACUVUQ_09660 [Thermodesulfovibrionales bacterium]